MEENVFIFFWCCYDFVVYSLMKIGLLDFDVKEVLSYVVCNWVLLLVYYLVCGCSRVIGWIGILFVILFFLFYLIEFDLDLDFVLDFYFDFDYVIS